MVDSDMIHHHLLFSKLELMAIGLSVTLEVLYRNNRCLMFAIFDPVGGSKNVRLLLV